MNLEENDLEKWKALFPTLDYMDYSYAEVKLMLRMPIIATMALEDAIEMDSYIWQHLLLSGIFELKDDITDKQIQKFLDWFTRHGIYERCQYYEMGKMSESKKCQN